jgi:ubiquitin-protein ligase
MQGQLPPGITLVSADNFETWFVDIQVIDPNPIYAGETYRLKFMFSQNYPIEVRVSYIQSIPPTTHLPQLAPHCSNQ